MTHPTLIEQMQDALDKVGAAFRWPSLPEAWHQGEEALATLQSAISQVKEATDAINSGRLHIAAAISMVEGAGPMSRAALLGYLRGALSTLPKPPAESEVT